MCCGTGQEGGNKLLPIHFSTLSYTLAPELTALPAAAAAAAGPNTPPGGYFIQLLEVVNGSNPTTYSAMGRSQGQYTIIPIDSRPTWLLALVGVFCCVGPLTLAAFLTFEKLTKRD